MSFWAELKRRNVFRVAAAYLVASWLIVQVIGELIDPLGLPDSFATIVVVLLGIGFPIALIIAWIYEVTPEGIRVTADVATSPPAGQSTHRLNYVIVVLLMLAVGLMAFDMLALNDRDDRPDAVADISETANAAQEPANVSEADANANAAVRLTLAVLPFDDSSQAGDQAYLANGIATVIRNTLSLIDDLDVIGPDTSAFFKERSSDLSLLREDWGVEYLLAGEVRSDNERIRIDVTLTDTATGTIEYTESVERVLEDSFPLLDEIAEKTARAMEITLGVGEVGGRPGMTRNARAFDAFLQATSIPRLSLEQVRTAVTHLERAVALDDGFSLAWVSLAGASDLVDSYLQSEGGDAAALARADEAMAKARELTPDLPELILTDLDRRLAGGQPDFFVVEQGIEAFVSGAAANDYPAHDIASIQALLLYQTGRIREATSMFERVCAVDPMDAPKNMMLAEAYGAQGRFDDGLLVLDEFEEHRGRRSETTLTAIYIALAMGNEEEIARRLAAWSSLDNPKDEGIYRITNLMARQRNDPEQALETLRDYVRSAEFVGELDPLFTAPWAAYFGDDALALEILERATAFQTGLIIPRPLMASLRETEDFKAYLRSAGLVAFWRESGNWPDYCEPVGLNDFECF